MLDCVISCQEDFSTKNKKLDGVWDDGTGLIIKSRRDFVKWKKILNLVYYQN